MSGKESWVDGFDELFCAGDALAEGRKDLEKRRYGPEEPKARARKPRSLRDEQRDEKRAARQSRRADEKRAARQSRRADEKRAARQSRRADDGALRPASRGCARGTSAAAPPPARDNKAGRRAVPSAVAEYNACNALSTEIFTYICSGNIDDHKFAMFDGSEVLGHEEVGLLVSGASSNSFDGRFEFMDLGGEGASVVYAMMGRRTDRVILATAVVVEARTAYYFLCRERAPDPFGRIVHFTKMATSLMEWSPTVKVCPVPLSSLSENSRSDVKAGDAPGSSRAAFEIIPAVFSTGYPLQSSNTIKESIAEFRKVVPADADARGAMFANLLWQILVDNLNVVGIVENTRRSTPVIMFTEGADALRRTGTILSYTSFNVDLDSELFDAIWGLIAAGLGPGGAVALEEMGLGLEVFRGESARRQGAHGAGPRAASHGSRASADASAKASAIAKASADASASAPAPPPPKSAPPSPKRSFGVSLAELGLADFSLADH